MEIVEGGRSATRRQKLHLDDYLDFFDNRALDLAPAQLRQIIGMHGFKKMQFQKSLSIEMISTMDLMDLRRSTLLDDAVSGDAGLALEEVIKDLKNLHWQECNVSSLLTQGAVVSPPTAAVAGKRKRGGGAVRRRSGGEGVPVKRKSVVEAVPLMLTNGGETVSVKQKSVGEAVPLMLTSGGEGVPVKRKSGGEAVPVMQKSGGETVTVKRKKMKSLKEIEQDAIEVGVGSSTFGDGTPVAAGSTPEVLRSLKSNSSSALSTACTTPFAASTTDILRALASNSLAAVGTQPMISPLTRGQLHRLLNSNKCFIAQSV